MAIRKSNQRFRPKLESLEARRVLASITGFSFLDGDGNGQRDANELGVSGVRVELRNNFNDLLQATITSNLGFYSFSNLPAGVYSVTAQQPAALSDGDESSGFPGVQIGSDEIANIELAETDVATEINFGELSMMAGYISPLWILSSSANTTYSALLRETVANAELAAGNTALATLIDESDGIAQPVATADQYETSSGIELSVPSSLGLLQNDVHPSSGMLLSELVTAPENGSLSLNPDGSFSYVANADYFGNDVFSYRSIDGNSVTEDGSENGSLPTTVFISVSRPPNRAPEAVADVYQTREDNALLVQAPGVLSNDIDADGNTLTAITVRQPTNGSLAFNGDGSFQYTPSPNYFGTDTFTYFARDGELESAETEVRIDVAAVNDPPQGSNDTYTTEENVTLVVETLNSVLANDTDIDSDTLEASLTRDVSDGILSLNVDGSFTYQPNSGFSGFDTFTYVIRDGIDTSDEVTVTIDVGAVNDAPNAVADTFTTDEDTTLASNFSILANDVDLDGDVLTAEIVQEPANGNVTLNADGTFTYTPSPNFSGEDTFLYVASDGLRSSDPTTVSIVVTFINDVATATEDQYGASAGETLVISADVGVLSNDLDVDNDSLIANLVASPNNGQVVLQPDGSFEYTPAAGFAGLDMFSYQANDGQSDSNIATVTINVVSVNTPPAAVDDSYEVDQNDLINISVANGVLANDTDIDDDQLTATLEAEPTNGAITLNADGSFTYTPATDFSGTDTFTYIANDGAASSTVATVTITVVAAPVTVVESVTLNASKDNSLFESATGNLSNGTGEYLFVGKTLQSENFLRRGLIAFDFSSIPADATITDVSLTLNMSRTIVGPFDVTLHPVLQDWGEGASDAEAEEGTGIDSATGDATWLHAFYDSQNWNAPGGDFTVEASASTSVDGVGFYSWSSAGMVADVQSWLDDPSTNAGWLLLTTEVEITAKRFDSRENATEANRPQLAVEYEVTTGAQIATASGEAIDHNSVDVLFAHIAPQIPGDANADGEVNFADFLALASNFGRTDSAFENGDFDGDGRTSFSDFLILADNFAR